VAGFSEDELKVDVKEQTLSVRGEKKAEDQERQFLHRGIATRAFERHFNLADYVEVTDAAMGEGLLVISLKRELPEALKPRMIPINAGTFMPLGGKQPEAIGQQAGPKLAA
jgi:molecular chaperone IbpA